MESIQQSHNDNFMEDASDDPPSSPDISTLVGVPQSDPRLGDEYQVEVPPMIKKSEWLQLLGNPADSDVVHDSPLSFAIGLPIQVTWIHNEVEDIQDDGCEYLRDIAKAAKVKKSDISDNGKGMKPITCQSVMNGDSNSGKLGKCKNDVLAPGLLSNSWSDADAKSFLLGLFIFGKNFIKIKRFLENKGMGEILSYYYGKFYKSDEYRRWTCCKKMKGRKCIIGHKLFTGQRQQELLSRLIPSVSKESQDTLTQIFKSYVEGTSSLEEYISSLKSTVGLGVLVEAVGIGKEKEDLTRLAVEPAKNSRAFSARTSKSWSSLGLGDIINFLTGGLRLSKAKSNDLFWEAVWPRLLARGWRSEQPNNQSYVSSNDYLVFLIPGVKKFSRRKLVKGDHYFDSVTDVLNKVAAEPDLLELEEDAKAGSSNDEELEKEANEEDRSNNRHQCYLKPRASSHNKDYINFMVIDTSLVCGGKSSDLRALKSAHVNSVGKIEIETASITFKGAKHIKKVNHSKNVPENIIKKVNHTKNVPENIQEKPTKFTVIDTSALNEGKLLKVRELRCLPAELKDDSKMTGLSRESKGNSSDNDSPCDEKNISNTDSREGMSDSGATNQKEAFGNNVKKEVESQQNQKNRPSDDNQLKKTIKHQFSRRPRSGHSNHAVLPIKRRRLSACVKAETARMNENSSGGLASVKQEFSHSPSCPDANRNVGEPVSHQQNRSLLASSADGNVEENNKESSHNEIAECVSISSVKVEEFFGSVEENNKEGIVNEIPKCVSISSVIVETCETQLPITSNIPKVPSKSENGETTATAMMEEDGKCLKENDPCLSSDTKEEVEEPPKTSCDVSSTEQQPRRQSTRNRPLSIRALESMANEFLHAQRRPKRKDIPTLKDPFTPCRRARTKGRKKLQRRSSDHEAAISVEEEKHLNGDCGVSNIFASR